jgi:hydroxymethylbilane synthase
MLRIAVSPTPTGRWQGQQAEAALAAAGVACALLEWNDAPEYALLRGDADAALCWLSDWPPAQGHEPVAVGALLSREYPFDLLVWRLGAADPRQDFFLKKEATVVGATALQKAQLAEFRPDLRWEASMPDLAAAFQRLRDGAADALMMAQADLPGLDLRLDEWSHAVLHPRECTPPPGQGTLALLARRDDAATRRLLQRAHQPQLSACTNVERRLLRETLQTHPGTAVGAYVEQGATRSFHLFAAIARPDGNVMRYRVSHSTNAELAEQALRYFEANNAYSRT